MGQHRIWRFMTGVLLILSVRVAPAVADPALITPMPKKMRLAGGTVAVQGGMIMLAGNEPKLRVAAEEINRRLSEELLAPPLPVKTGNIAHVRAAGGPVIVIGISGREFMPGIEEAFPVAVPGKTQGYGISMHGEVGSTTLPPPRGKGGSIVAVLSGHDAQGALYAAVTLRYLLDPAQSAKLPNGEAVLHLAGVQDWPDFPWRQIGRPPANVGIGWELKSASRKGGKNLEKAGAQFVKETKQYVDFMLRHKINLSWTHVTHLFRSGEGQYEYARMVSEYARARGVGFVEKCSSNVGSYPRDKDDPRKSCCVDHRVHKMYFCWSLLDVHEERARVIAKAMKESGIRWLYIHATDGGGWENPARWNDRCEHCREIYGDDHAKADAAVFGTYYRVIKQEIPDFKMIAVVYPYNGNSIDPESIEYRLVKGSGAIPNAKALAQKIAQSHQEFLTRLGGMLAPDIFVCQREVVREKYALMTKCYGKRNFQIYLEIKHGRGWNPEFTMASGWLKTFYRPGYQDVFYSSGNPWGYNYLCELMSAEFGWNVNAPGSREFTKPGLRQYDIDHHIEPTEVSRKDIAKFCRDFYGAEIGPFMVPVYDSNISYRFIQRPREIINSMRLEDAPERMQQTVAATERAWASLEKARQACDGARAAGRDPFPTELAAKQFGEMYRAALVSRFVAPYQLRMLQARPAVIGGDMDRAKELVAEMRDIMSKGRTTWKERWPWMRRIPINRGRNPNWVYTFGQFQKYDWSKREEEIAQFEKDMDKLFEAYNTPKWFKKAMKKRVLYAVPVSASLAIDGRLDEKAWRAAPKNEHFVNHKTSTPAEKETEARILYDGSALYVGYTAYEPGADRIPIRKKKREDQSWNPSHSVELFVDSSRDKQTYVQYIWGIDGSILDGRRIRDANGMLEMDNEGFTSKAEFAIARYPDRWTLEARIPAEELGREPKKGATWRANLCRNLIRSDGKRESTSTVVMEGSGFHTPEKFAELHFLRTVPPERKPIVHFRVAKKRAGQVTIGTGTGFEVVFDINLDTTKPLHNVSLKAEAFSGNARKGSLTIFEDQNVQLLWRSRQSIRYLVDTPEPGLHLDFHLDAQEGKWTFRRSCGSPQPRQLKATFTQGVSGQALADTAHFPAMTESARVFDSRQGTLEMWVNVVPPLDTEIRFGPDPQHVFFFQGPIRFDHPALDNTRTVCLRRVGRNLTARLSTKEYQQLWTGAFLGNWSKGGWHHVAVQWSAADANILALDLYLDGKKAGGSARKSLRERRWQKASESFFVQLGSAITGAGALGWAIDEVRVSAVPRYTTDFVPQNRAVLDEKATVVFHFDGSLEGRMRAGRKVTATAGPGAS